MKGIKKSSVTGATFIASFHKASEASLDIINSNGFDTEGETPIEFIARIMKEVSEATDVCDSAKASDAIAEFSHFEEELADIVITIMTYGAAHKLRMAEAILAKITHNATRGYMHGKEGNDD